MGEFLSTFSLISLIEGLKRDEKPECSWHKENSVCLFYSFICHLVLSGSLGRLNYGM
jgi:hypothetical protein